jgi:predicted glycosyltransferase
VPTHPQVVLVCPLDWGLGHASRVIPVINRFVECGYRVMIGGDGKSGELLKRTFPRLPFLLIPSPNVRYSGQSALLTLSLIWQLPKMLILTLREHLLIKNIVARYNIRKVVSDNRYGLYCRNAYCIFITHQISPKLPRSLRIFEYPLYLMIRSLIHRFDECWIPDYADAVKNLSGALSHRYRLPHNARYIGILSRFKPNTALKKVSDYEKYNLVIVLSGPEPLLGHFSEKIILQASKIHIKTLIINGLQKILPDKPVSEKSRLTVVRHLEHLQFEQALLQADKIVCRSGYSSIMDIFVLGKTALLVPTPGQPEQEYLASYLSEKGWFSCVSQKELDLRYLPAIRKDWPSSEDLPGFESHERLPIDFVSQEEDD